MSLLRALVPGVALIAASLAPAAAQSIASSQTQVCALSAAGQLYCWGEEIRPPMGKIHYDSTPMPMVDSSRRFVAVSVGWLHDCALTAEGKVVCWGQSASGQLGRNSYRVCGGCGVDTIETSLRFRSIVSGQSHSCALTLDRRAYCWGSNDAGQVGSGDRVETIYWPTAVVGGHRWLSLAAAGRHTCGITTAGRTLCWGANSKGALGYDQKTRAGCTLADRCMAVPYPVADTTRFRELFAGLDRTCGLTGAGTLHCWGGEFESRYGHYQNVRRDTDTIRTPVRLTAPFPIKSIALGYGSSCVLSVSQQVYCILENNLGTIGGAGVIADGRGTVKILDQPLNTPLRFTAITATGGNACGIATDGGVYCWGRLLISPEKLNCANPLSCTMLPYRVGGDLDLLKAANAKR